MQTTERLAGPRYMALSVIAPITRIPPLRSEANALGAGGGFEFIFVVALFKSYISYHH
jgi:hypothetical protein